MSKLTKIFAVRSPATDAQLLSRFVRDRDDAAFAEIVRRHGPMVLGVCRRAIADRHLVDDAFQATFVVLARKAGGIRSADRLASWLYGVSHRVALRARTMADRRAKRERLTAHPPETAVTAESGDGLGEVLDAEICNLPGIYRDAVLLCELQGVGRLEASVRLGVAEGTLSSRLAKARKLLVAALTRRGVALPALLTASATISPELCAAAVLSATGAIVPASVATLANGVIRMMFLTKLKLPVALGLVAALLLGVGVGTATRPIAVAAPVPVEPAAGPGLIWVLDPDKGELLGYASDGTKAKSVVLRDGKIDPAYFLGITRDGQHAMFAGHAGRYLTGAWEDNKSAFGVPIHLLSLHAAPKFGPARPISINIRFNPTDRYTTSSDGGYLYSGGDDEPPALTRFDDTGKLVDLIDLPAGLRLREVLADDQLLLERAGEAPNRAYRFAAKGEPVLLSGELDGENATLSPDGKSLLITEVRSPKEKPGDESLALAVVESATGTIRRIETAKRAADLRGVWAPDGKRIAYQWNGGKAGAARVRPAKGPRGGAGEIIVCDQDGTNAKRILEWKGDGRGGDAGRSLHLVGWFPTKAPPRKDARELIPADEADPDAGRPANAEEAKVDAVEFHAVALLKELGTTVHRNDRLPGKPVDSVFLSMGEGMEGALEELTVLRHLTDLSIDSSDAKPVNLKKLAGFKKLGGLHLSGTEVTEAAARELAALTTLRSLDLGRSQMTDAALLTLAPLKDLGSLQLGAGVTDAGLKGLAPFKKLFALGLSDPGVTDEGMKELGTFEGLTMLDLGGTGVTDDGVKRLAGFRSLARLGSLQLTGTKVTDAGAKEIARFKNLTTLSLFGTQVTDAGLTDIAALKNLTELALDGTAVTDAGIMKLASLKNLANLSLTNTAVTDDGVEALREAMPKCLIAK